MTIFSTVLVALSAIGFAVAFILYVAFLRRREERPSRPADLLNAAAAILLALNFLASSLAQSRAALATIPDSILFFALVLTCVSYIASRLTKNLVIRVMMLPLIVALEACALFFNSWFPTRESQQLVSSTFLLFHVSLFLVSYALFLLSAAFGLMFLLLDRILKSHDFPPLFFKLPGLTKLDALGYRSAFAGFLLLTAAMGIAFTTLAQPSAALDEAATISRDFTILSTLVLWAYYVGYLVLRHRLGWVGKRASYATVCGVLLVVVFYFAGKFVSGDGLHGNEVPLAAGVTNTQ